MHNYEYHSIYSPLCRSYSHLERISSRIKFLRHEIERIDIYPDRSFFFQNNEIIQSWLELVNDLKDFDPSCSSELDKDWDERTETNAGRLLPLRNIYIRYQELYKLYYESIINLLQSYPNWAYDICYTGKGMEILSGELFKNDFNGVEDVKKYLSDIALRSTTARSNVFSVLKDIFNVFRIIMNRGDIIVSLLNPTDIEFAKAIDNDLKEWTSHKKDEAFKKMKEYILRHFNSRLTEENKYDLWCQMLRADEDALKLAMRQELSSCEDEKQKHWGDEMKSQMDENGELMRLIYNSCYTDELLGLGRDEKVVPFINLLTPDNLEMFYDIILRRNIIQCEMYPELKVQHEEWLKGESELQSGEEDSGLDHGRRTKLDDIIQILQKGNWKLPATSEKIVLLLNALFGKDQSSLEEEDNTMCDMMWALIEGGRGERKMIVSANLAGFFADENLLNGTSKEISNDLFGNDSMINSVTDGKKDNRSKAFEAVVPFIAKYTNKIIRQDN